MNQLNTLKILIADDHFLIRQFVTNALMELKIENVQGANDGNEAIDMIQRAKQEGAPYDVVFLDWNMPTILGIEVLSYFRAKPEYADTAFVMLTAESEQQNIMKAIKAGATSYIVKPVSAPDLGKKIFEINEWLKRKRRVSGGMFG
ncbi:MAG: response regulator [Alphaproteobacteria bacterium]|nr:response regulator [Alphaproteobacteria bacterium]MCL2505623.1 response regulator [Alphaproteobacteria bacterium]